MKIILILVALFFSTMVSSTTLDKMVVFGDSLSDNGNLYEFMKREFPMSPPYYRGRFTNGPVWVELLMKQYYPKNVRAHLLDYAFGGAGVSETDEDEADDVLFTLNREIDSYLLSHDGKADESSLYVVWMGSNNYLAIPEDVDGAVGRVTSSIKRQLQRLVQSGARHIMVINVPDLGKTPAARDFDAVEQLTKLSLQHNAVLQDMVSELGQKEPSVQWLYFDVTDVMQELYTYPERYGLTNVVDTCYEEMVNAPSEQSVLKMVSSVKLRSRPNPCTGYLFFDPVHPSESAHVVMAYRTKRMFDEVGITFDDS